MTDTQIADQADAPKFERDIYEVANQLGGYVDPSTDKKLAKFLLRESAEAAKLADEIISLRRAAVAQGTDQWRPMDIAPTEHGAKIIGSYDDDSGTEIIQTLYYSTFDWNWRRKLDGMVVPAPQMWLPYPRSRHEQATEAGGK
jgi:hypothetical protein